MCMIIINETNKSIDRETLRDLIDINPDGAGVIWLDTYTVTRSFSPERLHGCTRPYIAHLRYATKGKVASKNNHPFSIGAGRYLMHNGTIKNIGGKTYSDTHTLAKALRGMSYSQQAGIVEIIADSTDSRMVIIDTRNRCYELFGAKEWEGSQAYDCWVCDDGIVYSKDCWVATTPLYSKYNYGTKVQSGYHGTIQDTWELPWKEDADLAITVGVGDLQFPVFVYGTLKRGYGNNSLLDGADFCGIACTTDGYTLEDGTVPYLHETTGTDYVIGELYDVQDVQTLQSLDDLEGHPYHYERKLIDIDSAQLGLVRAWAYHATHKLPAGRKTVAEWFSTTNK